jgi:hypothetical protein
VHTVLDLLTLVCTSWVIFMMLTKAKSSWQADKDTLLEVYIVCSTPFAVCGSPHLYVLATLGVPVAYDIRWLQPCAMRASLCT